MIKAHRFATIYSAMCYHDMVSQLYEQFYERLRRVGSKSSVVGSLPVLFFGDISSALIATVGLNPSHREYLDTEGAELTDAVGPNARRFETLTSLGAHDRRHLSQEQCDQAIHRMRDYFKRGKPVYKWFGHLERVTASMGYSYGAGQVVHLDLVQEATKHTYSELSPTELQRLRSADLPFLKWQLDTFPLRTVLCNGRTAYEVVRDLTNGSAKHTGRIARTTWWAGFAQAGGRTIGLAGWNLPLARATGLKRNMGRDGEGQLGKKLADALRGLGIRL